MSLAQTLVLPDSRILSYDDLGNPDGIPVIFFHGVPGSRRYWGLTGADDFLSERGVRLLSPDRPGIGRSSPAPHRCVLDFAKDIEDFADGLGLDRFGLIAYSGGSSYALATAASLPDRVAGVALISPVADLSIPTLMSGLDPLTRKGLRAVSHAPATAWRLPDRFDSARMLTMAVNQVWALLPSADRRALGLPSVKAAAHRMLDEAARHGLDGVRHDLCLMLEPWGFELAEVKAPVDVHVGSADPWSTSEMAHWLRVGLSSPRIQTYDGGGHFTVLVKNAPSVLDGLLERAQLERPVSLAAQGA